MSTYKISSGKSVQVGGKLFRRGQETELDAALKTLKADERKSLVALCLSSGTMVKGSAKDPGADEATIDRENASAGDDGEGQGEGDDSGAGVEEV